jgi:DNA-directed RNA polymerase subunit RPC12/RpoP
VRIRCNHCGAAVSTDLPVESVVIAAYVECPDCVERAEERVLLSAVLKAIDDEPEFPGDMPERLSILFSQSPLAMARGIREACRLTKAGIKEKLKSLTIRENAE